MKNMKKEYNLTLGVHLTKDPDIFTYDNDPLTYRGLMSCGHAVLPDSLSTYIITLVKQGINIFRCPYKDILNPLIECGKTWTFKEIRKMAMLNFEESQYIEKKMNENIINKQNDIFQCPECQSYCVKLNKKSKKINCKRCEILKKNSIFCSNCLHRWDLKENCCENPDCEKNELEISKILSSSLTTNIRGKEVPIIRKSPCCGILIEFYSNIKSCKSILCYCEKRFCMICLRFGEKDSEIPLCSDNDNNIETINYGKKCILK